MARLWFRMVLLVCGSVWSVGVGVFVFAGVLSGLE